MFLQGGGTRRGESKPMTDDEFRAKIEADLFRLLDPAQARHALIRYESIWYSGSARTHKSIEIAKEIESAYRRQLEAEARQRVVVSGLGDRKGKWTHAQAKAWLREQGVDFSKDYFAQRSEVTGLILEAARKAGYRKRPDAPGATSRMYYEFLSRRVRDGRGK